MKLERERDVLDLLDGYMPSAALGAALERGLFWQLDNQPLTIAQVAEKFNIPYRRCQHWLNLLVQSGLLEKQGDVYRVSTLTRNAILEKYSPDVWKTIAERAVEQYPIGIELGTRISHPGSLWELQGHRPPSDYERAAADPEWAARYTRMLYERAIVPSAQLAEKMDMTGVRRLMDFGGGSGVVSFALLRRYPALTSVVVDYENVCKAGREIALEIGLADRITYHPANILEDELPTGFDMVLESDVGIYDAEIFRRIYHALNPGGRLVLNQPWAEADGTVPGRLIVDNFRNSLHDPAAVECMRDEARTLMQGAGFQDLLEWSSNQEDIVLEGRKP